MDCCAQHFLLRSAMEKSCSSQSAKRNRAQMSAVASLAPRCLQWEGDWLQAFWVVTVLRECSVLNSAAVSSVGLDVGWHDAGQFCMKKFIQVAKLLARINNQRTLGYFCKLTSASGITGSTRKIPYPSSALHCIFALYW